jgi:predicted O-methyltransferase YrrM
MEQLTLNITGTHAELWLHLEAIQPDIRARVNAVRALLSESYPKRETRDYEAALLYILAMQYDTPGAVIAEVGTCYGWTAAIMQHAAPRARVMTCTPNPNHVIIARRNLAVNFPHIDVLETRSVDWLEHLSDNSLDMVYIDGDHQRIADDLPFYNKLKIGGLKFHHDYCPAAPECTGPRPCRWVYETLNKFADKMHSFDVLMVDHNREGVGGWYRGEGEVWHGTM